MRTAVLVFCVAALYVLHQDFWFWRNGRLIFGVLPMGLFYHAVYCVACAGLMWALVKFAWPRHLDLHEPRTGTGPGTRTGTGR